MADLPPAQRASYSALIDEILAAADLNTISAKAIRKQLQEKVEYDIAPQKKAITGLIMERFDKAQASRGTRDSGVAEPAPTTNGAVKSEDSPEQEDDDDEASPPASTNKRKASETEEDELSEVNDSSPAPKKKKKVSKSTEVESDEQLAARIQAELNGPMRSTRGGGAKRKTVSKTQKKSKKKTPAKIRADDDSELEGEDGEKPEKEKKGGFHKPMNLSEPLAALLGETQLSRPQTVKKIWEYVKERDLQEKSDKRNIICDEPLRAVFKSDKVHMFTMNKILAHHLFPADEAA